jgi:cytochrome o ubiquinol oxidase subunit 3
LAAEKRNKQMVLFLFGITFLLGAGFLGMELHEFRNLVLDGNSWRRSGFLSSYFTLVGTHGLHITVGLLWMAVMMIRVWKQDLTESTIRRLTLLSLFWHFLDIIWIFIFTIVYLFGVIGV